MEYDEDDLPAGFPAAWDALVEALRTYRIRTRNLGGARGDPEGAAERRRLYEKTEKWKEQHRKAAREYARRERSKNRGKP